MSIGSPSDSRISRRISSLLIIMRLASARLFLTKSTAASAPNTIAATTVTLSRAAPIARISASGASAADSTLPSLASTAVTAAPIATTLTATAASRPAAALGDSAPARPPNVNGRLKSTLGQRSTGGQPSCTAPAMSAAATATASTGATATVNAWRADAATAPRPSPEAATRAAPHSAAHTIEALTARASVPARSVAAAVRSRECAISPRLRNSRWSRW